MSMLLSSTAGAESLTNLVSAPPLPSLAPTGFSLIRLVGALAVVLGCFLGSVWLFRNWRSVTAKRLGSPELRIVEVKSLGSRQALWVVGYRRQRLLLGSSPAGMTLLTELPDAETDEAAPAPPVTVDFAVAFRQLLNPRK